MKEMSYFEKYIKEWNEAAEQSLDIKFWRALKEFIRTLTPH